MVAFPGPHRGLGAPQPHLVGTHLVDRRCWHAAVLPSLWRPRLAGRARGVSSDFLRGCRGHHLPRGGGSHERNQGLHVINPRAHRAVGRLGAKRIRLSGPLELHDLYGDVVPVADSLCLEERRETRSGALKAGAHSRLLGRDAVAVVCALHPECGVQDLARVARADARLLQGGLRLLARLPRPREVAKVPPARRRRPRAHWHRRRRRERRQRPREGLGPGPQARRHHRRGEPGKALVRHGLVLVI
mmetsp:Transcript_73539/g.198159  ORF Transcript_73539/g.198159 Transcript_73539/m.198159 type:complete len:245 (+) Transcript_73539:229-963(+)